MPRLMLVGLILFGASGAFSLWMKRQESNVGMLSGFVVATACFILVTYQVIITYPWDW